MQKIQGCLVCHTGRRRPLREKRNEGTPKFLICCVVLLTLMNGFVFDATLRQVILRSSLPFSPAAFSGTFPQEGAQRLFEFLHPIGPQVLGSLSAVS